MSVIQEVCEEETECFSIPGNVLETIISQMTRTYYMSLSDNPVMVKRSSIKVYTTPLFSNVPRREFIKGLFYSIDLRENKLKFSQLKFVEGSSIDPHRFSYDMPQSALTGTLEDLFDFIANSVRDALISIDMAEYDIPLMGVIFSCRQGTLDSEFFVQWTRNFTTNGVEGQDDVNLLKKSFDKLGLRVEEFLFINDITATLLIGQSRKSSISIAVINRAGENASCITKSIQDKKWEGDKNINEYTLNIEWGAFGENGELDDVITVYDDEIDKNSNNVGQLIYQKMISGVYIGELVRLVLIKISEKVSLFEMGTPEFLKQRNSFPESLLYAVYSRKDFTRAFKEYFNYDITEKEHKSILYVCDEVSLRSARLISVGIFKILQIKSDSRNKIAASGSLFCKHPKFSSYVKDTIKQLNKRYKTDMELQIYEVDDESDIGVVIAAYSTLTDNSDSK